MAFDTVLIIIINYLPKSFRKITPNIVVLTFKLFSGEKFDDSLKRLEQNHLLKGKKEMEAFAFHKIEQ